MALWTRLIAGGLTAGLVAGCELLVPDTVPTYTCAPGTGTCPAGMICNQATQACIYPADVVVVPDSSMQDQFVDEEAAIMDVVVPPEAETNVCRGLGCKCSGGTDCDSRICADATTVTPGLFSEVNHGFCIAPCCTSADCDAGFVCYGTDAGGNYCVDPSLLGRSTTLGMMGAGASCTSASQCRSGACSGNLCADTCCSMYQGGECAGGSQCRYSAFPGSGVDTNFTAHCTSTGGSTGNDNFCSSDGNCKSDFCLTTCVGACRTSSDCGSGNSCFYETYNSDLFASCGPENGTTAMGDACNPTSSTCATAFCDTATSKCTDVCYKDSDCAAVTGWYCRPEAVKVGPATASILLCGP